jgi:hypothetical protein
LVGHMYQDRVPSMVFRVEQGARHRFEQFRRSGGSRHLVESR